MCGRYYRRSDKQRIAEAFKLGKLPEGFVLPDWDYNVAPSTFQPIIRQTRKPATGNSFSCAGAWYRSSRNSFPT
jgi:putative SOS response-associated peptidase YedK